MENITFFMNSFQWHDFSTKLEKNVHLCEMKSECKMKKIYLFALLLSVVSMILLPSCKKKKDEDREYMTGSVKFEFPQYCLVGATIEAYCTGISNPTDVSYYWVSSQLLGKDTLFTQSATFHIPDSAGSYIVTAFASAKGYYQSSMAATVTAIDPDVQNGSISGLKQSEKTFVDERDGVEYMYVSIGSLDWMAENLEYSGTQENKVGVGFYTQDVLRSIFGTLYSWNDATGGVSGSGLAGGPQGVCPAGWSIPTNEDWEDLGSAINGGTSVRFSETWEGLASHLTVEADFNTKRMWPYAPKFEKKNTYGWNAIPCGHSTDNYTRFRHLLEYGMWWSAAEQDGKGAYRYIYYNTNAVPGHYTDKFDFGASVRCVRMSQPSGDDNA
jgi:uncharacterized protein (TIGR02145 family)